VAASTATIPACFYKYTITDSLLRQAKKCTIIVSSCMSIEEMICRCLRCGHEWVKRLQAAARPVRCPACKQHNWDKELGEVKMGRPPKKPAAAPTKVRRASAKRKTSK
jgi:DNA-directed RNA polymerase subunit RPC12/RpoP